jgi:hypothetical protein
MWSPVRCFFPSSVLKWKNWSNLRHNACCIHYHRTSTLYRLLYWSWLLFGRLLWLEVPVVFLRPSRHFLGQYLDWARTAAFEILSYSSLIYQRSIWRHISAESMSGYMCRHSVNSRSDGHALVHWEACHTELHSHRISVNSPFLVLYMSSRVHDQKKSVKISTRKIRMLFDFRFWLHPAKSIINIKYIKNKIVILS